jgi:hypothetical protein
MQIELLQPFVGEWRIEASFADAPAGRTMFEWLSGGRFLVQRWEVPHPAAPDGIAIIGLDPEREGYLQHYFDSRGVARVYKMSFGDKEWKLWREEPDFSPLDFAQRYLGRFSEDGKAIRGSWETSNDGASWTQDFELTYRKLN